MDPTSLFVGIALGLAFGYAIVRLADFQAKRDIARMGRGS